MTPEIIAHRGASYLAPENTLTAFRKAVEIGADGVEMDVQQTVDAGLVIHHDYIIDLHTDISGKIYDMTMFELRDLDFGSWKDAIFKDEKIATLHEALQLCHDLGRITVQLELKATVDNDPDFVPRVVAEIRDTQMVDRVILISFNHDLLRQAKQLEPQLRVGALVYGAVESMLFPPQFWDLTGIASNWQEENGLEEPEQLPDTVTPEELNAENSSQMTRWLTDKVSMLRASFPGESLQEIYTHLQQQRDPADYAAGLDFKPDYISCEYHTAYSNPTFIRRLHRMGIKVALWTVDTQDAVEWLLTVEPDAFVTNRPDRVREWMEKAQTTAPDPADTPETTGTPAE